MVLGSGGDGSSGGDCGGERERERERERKWLATEGDGPSTTRNGGKKGGKEGVKEGKKYSL